MHVPSTWHYGLVAEYWATVKLEADMIELCRRRAPDAKLWVSTLHELDPPRRYASIVCSGVLGLGSTRGQDTWGV